MNAMKWMPKVSIFFCRNVLLYFAWILAHYISVYVYTYACVPNTMIGILTSPFMTAAPHCIGIRWVITKSGDSICMMWIIVGNVAISHINSSVKKYTNPLHSEPSIYEVVDDDSE